MKPFYPISTLLSLSSARNNQQGNHTSHFSTLTFHLATVLLALTLSTTASAFRTSGSGNTYTLRTLSQTEASGVTYDAETAIYTLTVSDTIAAGDRFIIDEAAVAEFADGVALVVEGEADLSAPGETVFRCTEGARGYGIIISGTGSATRVSHCRFEGVGLRCGSPSGMEVSDCTFSGHNGISGQAALFLGPDGAAFTIRSCTFELCSKAAISSAANYRTPLLVEDCTFLRNGQANGNTPQLNLTVADSVVVRRCTITGDPEKTRVGGITVANLINYDGDYVTVIEDNTITDNRFGIATYLWQKAYIKNNTIIDNNHETNAMNGGSGINVYDPYYRQYTYIEGNTIDNSLWGITLVGGAEANLGRTDVAPDDPRYNPGRNTFRNNGNGGQLYDLYNNSTNTVYAQGNTWNVAEQTEAEIEKVVFHEADDASLGRVIFMPAGDDAQGIATVANDKERASHPAFTLQGRRATAGSKGIVVSNGSKKVVR